MAEIARVKLSMGRIYLEVSGVIVLVRERFK